MRDRRRRTVFERGGAARALAAVMLAVSLSACTNAADKVSKGETAETDGAKADEVTTTAVPEGAMALSEFYRNVLQAEAPVAECYTKAANALGLNTVADLEAAESNVELSRNLSTGLDACTATKGSGA